MSTPLHAVISSQFVSAGVPVNISLPSGYTKFEMYNMSSIGSTAANSNVMYAVGTSDMPAGYAYYNPKTSGAATLALTIGTQSGGFTFVPESDTYPPGAPIAVTAVSQANPAVVSTGTTTGLVASSSIVRLTNITGMQQISSLDFTVGTISAGVSFQLKYLNSSGFAAAGTGGTYTFIPFPSAYYPKHRIITAMGLGSTTTVTMSVTCGYVVGQEVRLVIPAIWGPSQLNGMQGTITAINTTTNTITLNINSSGMTSFAFPTSAQAAAGLTFAQVTPIGEAATYPYQNLLDDATVNQSFTGVQIGTTVQTSGETYQWIATQGVSI
jgi:hypothetical protein